MAEVSNDINLDDIEILDGISNTAKIIAYGYLDFIIYFFFVLALSIFIFFAVTKIPPFNKPIVRFYTLSLISVVGMLLFFKMYLYILLLFVSVFIGLMIWVREEIRQIFLVMNYKRKPLRVDLGEYEKLTVMAERADDIYSRFGFIKTFQVFKNYGSNNINRLKRLNDKSFAILIYINIFALFILLMNIYSMSLIYETGYYLFTE